jgi:hypothetical protein
MFAQQEIELQMLRVIYVGSFIHYEVLLICRPSLFSGLQFLRMLLAFAAIYIQDSVIIIPSSCFNHLNSKFAARWQ